MFVIRPARLTDEDSLLEILKNSGIGITSLPHDPVLMRKKIQASINALSVDIHAPQNEQYFFVLENFSNSTVCGCCGIHSRSGVTTPDHYFAIEELNIADPIPHQKEKIKVLTLSSHSNGPSTLCSLFLLKNARHSHLGRLLSLSRLLFIAKHPTRFTPTLISSIRGPIENNICPFWEEVGRNFLDVDFPTLMGMLDKDRSFVPKFIPKFPVYVCLLSKSTQNLLGETHKNSSPALKMLLDQGFTRTNEVDLFDAGPRIEAKISQLKVVAARKTGRIVKIDDHQADTKEYLISNGKTDFRACYGKMKVSEIDEITLDSTLAKALEVGVSDTLDFVVT